MSLKERQEAMRKRLELERVHQHEGRWPDIEQRSISGYRADNAVTEAQTTWNPKSVATNVEADRSRRLLGLKAAGTYLGVSYWTMRDLVFSKLIPTVKIPCPRAGDGRIIRRLLVDRRDLDAFIENHKELEK